MNYFELFELPLSFQVDYTSLKKKYDELEAKHNQAGDSGEHTETTRAYTILQDQDKTIAYLLQVKGLLQQEEHFEPDPQFLMEVMDINEELAELEMDEKQEQLMNVEQKTNRLMLKIYEDVAPVIESYREAAGTEEELLQVKDFYFRKKYLQRILDRIRGIRNIASPL